MIVIAKIGTSSVTASDGSVDTAVVGKLCSEVAGLRRDGHTVVSSPRAPSPPALPP